MKIVNERFNAKWSEEKNRKIRKIKTIIILSLSAVLVLAAVVTLILFWTNNLPALEGLFDWLK